MFHFVHVNLQFQIKRVERERERKVSSSIYRLCGRGARITLNNQRYTIRRATDVTVKWLCQLRSLVEGGNGGERVVCERQSRKMQAAHWKLDWKTTLQNLLVARRPLLLLHLPPIHYYSRLMNLFAKSVQYIVCAESRIVSLHATNPTKFPLTILNSVVIQKRVCITI